ncbi:MAG: hypothetical protein HQ518_14610 [Rhodopirellula sp.]|nr:hypothetical protein [Rhodopirellula sp.]
MIDHCLATFGVFLSFWATAPANCGQDGNVEPESELSCGPAFRIQTVDGFTEDARFIGDRLRLAEDRQLQNGMRLDFATTTWRSRSCEPITIATFNTGEVLPGHWQVADRLDDDFVPVSTLFGEPQDARIATPRFWPAHATSPLSVARRIQPQTQELVTTSQMAGAMMGERPGLSSIRVPSGCVDSSPSDVELHPDHQWRIESSRRVSDSESAPLKSPESDETSNARSSLKFWRRQRFELPAPLENGVVVLGLEWPILPSEITTNPPEAPGFFLADTQLRFLFGTADGNTLPLEVTAGANQISVRLPNGRLSHTKVAAPFPVFSIVRVTLADGLSLSMNEFSIARMKSVPGQLFAVEADGVFAAMVDTKEQRDRLPRLEVPWVRHGDRSAVDALSGRDLVWHSLDDDRLVLNSGDELFGQVTEVTRKVTFGDSGLTGQIRQLDRTAVRAVTFRRANDFTPRTVDGFFSQIELVPDSSCGLAALEEPFWMRTALVQSGQDGLRTRHPLLGDVLVRWSMIRRIRPFFHGSYTLIDPGPRHLGNGFRESFSRVEPDGTELSLNFDVDRTSLELPVFLSGDVAELIPSGLGTLRATPFLDDVRAGFLATRVFLNGELVGTLNDLIKVRSPATDPHRVRLRLPARQLKAGENAIQIRQTSAKDDATSFDDFEIRAIAIEVEHPA